VLRKKGSVVYNYIERWIANGGFCSQLAKVAIIIAYLALMVGYLAIIIGGAK
jgi:hypothetical protein